MEQEDFGGGPLRATSCRSLRTNLPSRRDQCNGLYNPRDSGAVGRSSPLGEFAMRWEANNFDTPRSLCDNYEKPSPRSCWKFGPVLESETAIN
jgi:hypothetical protein